MQGACSGCRAWWSTAHAAIVVDWGESAESRRATSYGTAHVIEAARDSRKKCADWCTSATEAGLCRRHAEPRQPTRRAARAEYHRPYPANQGAGEPPGQAANRQGPGSGGGAPAIHLGGRGRGGWGTRGDKAGAAEDTLGDAQGPVRRTRWQLHHSTCHVRNVCEGAMSHAGRGRGCTVYFTSRLPTVSFLYFFPSSFMHANGHWTQGVTPHRTRHCRRGLVYAMAGPASSCGAACGSKGGRRRNAQPLVLLTVDEGNGKRRQGACAQLGSGVW